MDYSMLGRSDGKLYALHLLVTGNRITSKELEAAAKAGATRTKLFIPVEREKYVEGFKQGYTAVVEPS